MTQQRIDTYLDRLDRELADLPRQQRSELVAEIRDHLDEALASNTDPSEADVLNVLERLGDPANIAEEARERFGVCRAGPRWTDWLAVVLLPFGGLLGLVLGLPLAVLGWAVGAMLLLNSRMWSKRDRMLGLLLFPGGELLPLLLLVGPGQVCGSSSGPNGQTVESCSGFSLPLILGLPLLIVLVATPMVMAVYLSSKLRARTDEAR
jgi:hypothetical protein